VDEPMGFILTYASDYELFLLEDK